MNINFLLDNLPDLIGGVLTTLELTFCALALGLSLALLFTFINFMRSKVGIFLLNIYSFFIRGTPLLIQIFLIYYGSGQFAVIRDSFLWPLLKQPFGCAMLALAINTSAYTYELFRGIIASIPKGELQACAALGLSRAQMLHKIIAPRALRMVLPAYSNEVIIILKSTTLASTITLLDLLGVINQLIAQTYETIPLLVIAGVIYLLLTLGIIKLFHIMERRYYLP
jgi:arginine transport system permease protein